MRQESGCCVARSAGHACSGLLADGGRRAVQPQQASDILRDMDKQTISRKREGRVGANGKRTSLESVSEPVLRYVPGGVLVHVNPLENCRNTAMKNIVAGVMNDVLPSNLLFDVRMDVGDPYLFSQIKVSGWLIKLHGSYVPEYARADVGERAYGPATVRTQLCRRSHATHAFVPSRATASGGQCSRR